MKFLYGFPCLKKYGCQCLFCMICYLDVLLYIIDTDHHMKDDE